MTYSQHAILMEMARAHTKRRGKDCVAIYSHLQGLKAEYSRALLNAGLRCRWFRSSAGLKAWIRDSDPTVIIVDVESIRDDSPHEFFETLRHASPTSDLVVLSDGTESGLLTSCVRFGCADILKKPITPEELSWSVVRVSNRRKILLRRSPEASWIRAVSQLSSCSSEWHVHAFLAHQLRDWLGAPSMDWFRRVHLTWNLELRFPTETRVSKKLSRIPKAARNGSEWIWDKKCRELWIPAGVDHWYVARGLQGEPSKAVRTNVTALLHYADLCIAQLEELQTVRRQSFVDDLTGLYNARYLRHCLAERNSTAENTGTSKRKESISVLFIDIDHFKSINDKHGHVVGSRLLSALGRAFQNTVRRKDFLFRYGGDEFVVLIAGVTEERALAVAERIRKQIESRTFVVEGISLRLTVSIGVATYPKHTDKALELLKVADHAMYAAKVRRNSVFVAGSSLLGRALPEPQKDPKPSSSRRSKTPLEPDIR